MRACEIRVGEIVHDRWYGETGEIISVRKGREVMVRYPSRSVFVDWARALKSLDLKTR